jgi:hypothetical protein
MESPARLEKIANYIIDRHPVKTRNKEFTAMMCVSSVDVLIKYYEIFARLKAEGKHKLRIATIFSYTSNEEDKDADGILDDDSEIIGGEGGNPHTREKLDGFISDYNAMFGTGFSTRDTQSFYNYYQDIAKQVKAGKVDILLVVNMFLTGFDSVKLNTMYVDKNLRYHGLIQAYSRTNRILNEVKSQGNIVVFRNLKKRTDEAIALFSNVNAKEDIFVPPYEEYVKLFNAVTMDLLALVPTVKDVANLKDEEEELKFVKLFRELMRLRNILESFSEFEDRPALRRLPQRLPRSLRQGEDRRHQGKGIHPGGRGLRARADPQGRDQRPVYSQASRPTLRRRGIRAERATQTHPRQRRRRSGATQQAGSDREIHRAESPRGRQRSGNPGLLRGLLGKGTRLCFRTTREGRAARCGQAQEGHR